MSAKAKKEDQTPLEEKSETSTEVATQSPSGKGLVTVDEDLTALYSQGDEFTSEDLTIPFIRIAQKLSPQVDKDAGEYIEGLEPGMIFNTATGEFWDGNDGVAVIIATARRELTEWKPRGSGGGGGLVENYGTDLSPLTDPENTKNDKGRVINKDKNELVEAMQYYVQQVDVTSGFADPAVISMSSSNFKPARDLNLMLRTAKFQLPNGQVIKKPSSFLYVYKLTTVKRQNDDGTWYVFKPQQFCLTQELPNGKDLLVQASEFKKMVVGGKVKADHETAGADGVEEADVPF